jgi:hypothetical protein
MNSPAGSSPAKTEVSRGKNRQQLGGGAQSVIIVWLRTLVFFSLITLAHANLDNLINAAQSFE